MRTHDVTPCCINGRIPKVFVVSNVALVSEGIHFQLSRSDKIVLAGRGAVHAPTVGAMVRTCADVAVLDFASTGAHDFAEALVTQIPGLKIVGIAIGSTSLPVADWAQLGVVGFVDDNGSIDDVVAAILRVSKGDYALSPATTNALVSGLINRCESRREPQGARKLTPREIQILTDLERGATNKEIARRLGISAHTVKNHVHHILEKLEVRRREDAGRFVRAGRI